MAVKRTIRFRDLDGNLVEQDWYFSLDKTDALEMNLVRLDDVVDYLNRILKSGSGRQLLEAWRELLFRSVGSREGNLLIKNDRLLRIFQHGGAFEQLLTELLESDDAGEAFFLSIIPEDVRTKFLRRRDRKYSKEELLAMTDDEFTEIAGDDESKMSREYLMISRQRKTNRAA